MATTIENASKSEVRSVIRFLHAQGKNGKEIHSQIVATYGGGFISKSQVYRWCSLSDAGHTSLIDEARSGRPSMQERTVSAVDELIKQERRLKVREIAEKLDIFCLLDSQLMLSVTVKP